MNLPPNPLTWFYATDAGRLTLRSDRVSRWEPGHGPGFLEQIAAVSQPVLVPDGLNYHPTLQFNGRTFCLHFRGFAAEKGPHTFIFVAKPENGGLILASSRVQVRTSFPEFGENWQIIEAVRGTNAPINGRCVIGADYDGQRGFWKGEIAAIGYRRGLLSAGQRETLYAQLRKKYSLKEKEECSDISYIKIPLPSKRLLMRLMRF